MTDTEWQEIENYVRVTARQTVMDILASEKPSRESSSVQDKKKGIRHEWERELIRQGLERYRTEPPDSNIRKGIDWLLQRHDTIQKCYTGPEKEFFRKRHNAMVLEYIISHPMTRTAIEKRLGISDNGYKNQLEKGINELAQILFGYRE